MDNQGDLGKTERQSLIEELLGLLDVLGEDEPFSEELRDPKFLSEVCEENLRALIESKKEVYRTQKSLYDILKNRKSDTSQK